MPPRLIYLADVRLPTEKAHGWQIVKMCEAFAAAGTSVELRSPRRRQDDPAMRGCSIFEYYGVPEVFATQQLRGPDVVVLEPHLPEAVSRPLIQGYAVMWEGMVAWRAREGRPDLIYTRDLWSAAWAGRLGIPCAFEVHQLPSPRILRVVRSMSRRTTTRIVALTPYIRDAFDAAGFDPGRITVEGDAVDPTAYLGLPTQGEARAALHLPAGMPIIGYAGRFHTFHEEKGLPELVRAMAHVGDVGGKAPILVCVGGPMDRVPRYLELGRAEGLPPERLRFVDRVSNAEVPLWLRAFDVGVMPYPNTRHVALASSPLKMFEFMAAGTPIVATDLPSSRLVLKDGVSARLVPPADPRAIGEAVGGLLRDPKGAEALARAARRSVAGRTWEARAARILRFAGVPVPAAREVAS